jgi:multiple sugar transport system permease protein
MYAALGRKDSFWPMTLFYAMFSIPFSLWILKGFMDGVSLRFDETGLANKASRFHIIFKVILPQVKPGLIAAFVFNMISVWNEFLFNFILGGKQTTMIPTLLVRTRFSKAASIGLSLPRWAPFTCCRRSSRSIFFKSTF